MRIFVLGASGYIGFAVSRALRRNGHDVFGLVRRSEAALMLNREEIHPVLGMLQDPEGYIQVAQSCSVIVYAAADYSVNTMQLDHEVLQALMSAVQYSTQQKLVVYTSGAWVYGNTDGAPASETSRLQPPDFVKERPAIEQMVLDHSGVRGVVMRPGDLYGGRGGLTGMWFRGASRGFMEIAGDGRNYWPMIHVEDVADAYVRVVEQGASGLIFNLSHPGYYTVRQMAQAAATAAGYHRSIKFVPLAAAVESMGNYANCLALDQRVSSAKAEQLLGWKPKFAHFIDDTYTHYLAWDAYQSPVKR